MNTPLKNAISLILTAMMSAVMFLVPALGQNNPVPQIVGPVHPSAVAPGSQAFTLRVYGANFVPGAVVNWDYQPRVTSYISAHELQAQILATDVGQNTAGYITVTNPAPGGGSSSASWAQVEVHDPISTIAVSLPQYYVFGFWQLQAADFNHDRILDLLGEYFGLSLELGQGNGTFQPVSPVDKTNLPLTGFGYGDFNGDGNLDVVSFSYINSLNGLVPTRMNVLLGDGKGDFSRASVLTTTHEDFYYVTVGDFNQDGKLDLVTKYVEMSTWLGKGNGTFRRSGYDPDYSFDVPGGILAGDFNDDGKLDLVLMEEDNAGEGPLKLWLLLGKGDGTFQKKKEIAAVQNTDFCGFESPLQMSDFNGDGKLDIAFCTSGQIGVMLGNGDGTFLPPHYYTADPTSTRSFTFGVGDINSDGNPDLLAYEYSDTLNPQFVIFLGNGDGTFQPAQTIAVASTPFAELGIPVGDFNNDGLLDFMFMSDLGMDVFIQQ